MHAFDSVPFDSVPFDSVRFDSVLTDLAAIAVDHRRAGRDCCAQQAEQLALRISRALDQPREVCWAPADHAELSAAVASHPYG